MPTMDSNVTANTTAADLQEPRSEAQAAALPGPVGPGNKKRRSRAKQLDWNRHRDELKQLYVHEEKTLAEVMETMETKYRFVARSVCRMAIGLIVDHNNPGLTPSSKQDYKRVFKAWEWRRYLPRGVAQAMVRKGEARERAGRDTVFLYGGREVTRDQAAQSYARARQASTAEGWVVGAWVRSVLRERMSLIRSTQSLQPPRASATTLPPQLCHRQSQTSQSNWRLRSMLKNGRVIQCTTS
jgi:hypothetical protein